MTPPPPVRVLQISPSIPHSRIPHAGGRYVRELDRALIAAGHRVVLAHPPGPLARGEAALATGDVTVVDVERTVAPSPLSAGVLAAAGIAARLTRRSALDAFYPPFAAQLLLSPRTRRLIRTADVIDLQWFDAITLAPLLRAIAPRGARIIGTFHDVVSQRTERSAALLTDPGERRRALGRSRRQRRAERAISRALDDALVFSGKDRDLLAAAGVRPEIITVVPPPFESPERGAATRAARGGDPRVLLVGWLAREENREAVRWALREIWPLVRARLPGAELYIIGAGASPDIEELAAATPGAVLRGFVDDLEAEHAAARCALVPLRDGAGVKFKTLEALLAGLPTVSTPIGAEGVGDASDFTVVSDDPRALARGVVRAVTDPAETTRAASAAERMRVAHSRDAFSARIARIYRPRGLER